MRAVLVSSIFGRRFETPEESFERKTELTQVEGIYRKITTNKGTREIETPSRQTPPCIYKTNKQISK